MRIRRLLPFLALLALLVAPFGRMAAAEAMTSAHGSAVAMTGHCDDGAAPGQPNDDSTDQTSIDCFVACAAMSTAQAVDLAEASILISPPASFSPPSFAGRHPEADPPPPRLS